MFKDAFGKEINLGSQVCWGQVRDRRSGRVIKMTVRYQRRWVVGGVAQERPAMRLTIRPDGGGLVSVAPGNTMVVVDQNTPH